MLDSPPADIEAERGLLSSMMQGGSDSIATAQERIKDDCAEWFSLPSHGSVYNGLIDDWRQGVRFDLILFTGKLRDSKVLESIGGVSFVTELWGFVPSAANLSNYVDRLADKRWLRHIHATGLAIAKQAMQSQDDLPGILRAVETALLRVVSRNGRSRNRSTRQVVGTVMDNMSEPEKILGISTGFTNLDEVVGGLAEGAKIVLAGPISGGKSAFAECMAESLAVTRNIPVAMFTFEMSAEQKAQRLIQIRSEVSVRKIARKEATLFECDDFTNAAGEIAGAPIWLIEERLDIAGIRSRCLQLKPRVAIIDYLQIVPEAKQRGENTTDKLDRMSAETKQIAHDLGITVIELSQLTIDEKSGKARTRGSSGITADADQLWIIGGDDEEEKAVIHKQITVAKQRDGQRAHVDFILVKAITKFRQAKPKTK